MQWFFARRYLLSSKSHSVVNIIATVSVISVAVPVAAMVILLSVFNGFESLVKQMYKSVDADIEITCRDTASDMKLGGELEQRVREVPGVASLSCIAESQAILQAKNQQVSLILRGVDENYLQAVDLEKSLSAGDIHFLVGEREKLLLGEGVARQLGIYSTADSTIQILALNGSDLNSILPQASMQQLQMEMCGMVRIDEQTDSSLAICPLQTLLRLCPGRDEASAWLIRTEKGYESQELAARLTQITGEGLKVETREQKNAIYYSVMRYEKWGVFFVSLLVMLIASMSIIGTVVMLIVDKKGEQTTLLSMGAGMDFIRGIFVREGLLISFVGGTAGLLMGICTVLAQQKFHFVSMPSGNFLIDAYPVELQFTDLLIIIITFTAVTLLVSKLATATMIQKEKNA